MATKSSSLRVSKMVKTVCFAISFRKPVIDPEVSSIITISLGDAAALMYLYREKNVKINTVEPILSCKL